jgi:hypothetical protein
MIFKFACDSILELCVKTVRPNYKICELWFDGMYHPWYGVWEKLTVHTTDADAERKIVEFYKHERNYLQGYKNSPIPGTCTLEDECEIWKLRNCRISDVFPLKEVPGVKLEVSFDDVSYENKKYPIKEETTIIQ